MPQGFIKIGKNTAGHKDWLQAHGYEVAEANGQLVIEVSSFVEGGLNLSGEDRIEVLKGLVEAKQAFDYKTPIVFADGKGGVTTLSGVFACPFLGKASALMMKQGRAKKASTATAFDTL